MANRFTNGRPKTMYISKNVVRSTAELLLKEIVISAHTTKAKILTTFLFPTPTLLRLMLPTRIIIYPLIIRPFSERELTRSLLCCRPSVCRLSVCLSVCLSSVTVVRPTQAVQIFGNISTSLGTLATENFTELVPGEPLRRGS